MKWISWKKKNIGDLCSVMKWLWCLSWSMQLTLLLALTLGNLQWKLWMMWELSTNQFIFDHPAISITWMSLHLCGKRKSEEPSLELQSLKKTYLLLLQVFLLILVSLYDILIFSFKTYKTLQVIFVFVFVFPVRQRITYQKA